MHRSTETHVEEDRPLGMTRLKVLLELMRGTGHHGVELQVKLSQKRFYLNLTLKMAVRVDKREKWES